MASDVRPVEGWPRLMSARIAAAYCDEKSVQAFRRGVGKIYPRPRKLVGKGTRWLREDLDRAIDRLAESETIKDLADVL